MNASPAWEIPLSDVDFDHAEVHAVTRVLASGWLSMGPEVSAFEKEFAEMQQCRHAIAVSNATAGLHLALLAINAGPGDEIIQPALNFVAAANMTLAVGATPVFADISDVTEPVISPDDVERLTTSRTKAVIAMHYGGHLCRMAELKEICARRDIVLIEDACHAVGLRCESEERVQAAGSIGHIGVFSFFANKNLVTGEGGMVVTESDVTASRVRLLRSHGMTSLTWDRHQGHASTYDVVANGYNYRLDELRAAIGRAQLRKLYRNNERRNKAIAWYEHHILPGDGWDVPFRDRPRGAGHLMVLLTPGEVERASLARMLRDAGIQTSMHYPMLQGFSAFATDPLTAPPPKRTQEFCSRAITLPLFPTMTSAQVSEVCRVIDKIRDA